MAYVLTYTNSGTTPDIIIGDDGVPYKHDGSQFSAADYQSLQSNGFDLTGVDPWLFNGGSNIPFTTGENGEPVYSDATSPLGAGISGVGNSPYGYIGGTDGQGNPLSIDIYGNPISSSRVSSGGGSGSSTGGVYGGGGFTGGSSSGGGGFSLSSPLDAKKAAQLNALSMGMGGGGASVSGTNGLNGGSATTYNGTSRQTMGSNTPPPPTTSVYAPSPGSYTEAMNAELSELDRGMRVINNLIERGQIKSDQQLSAALNDLSSKTGLGINELQTAFQQGVGAVNQGYGQAANALQANYGAAIGQYDPVTAGVAGDVESLRQHTIRGFDDDFARYQASQAFQAPLQQATDNINQSAAAARMKFSSGNLKNLGQYISDYTANGYNDYRSQRMGEAQNLANTSLNALQNQTNMRGQLGSQLASTFGAQGSNVGQLQGQYGTNASNAYSTLGANLAGYRQGFTGINTDLSKSLAEATGQYYGARADARNRGLTGRGTSAITIKV